MSLLYKILGIVLVVGGIHAEAGLYHKIEAVDKKFEAVDKKIEKRLDGIQTAIMELTAQVSLIFKSHLNLSC